MTELNNQTVRNQRSNQKQSKTSHCTCKNDEEEGGGQYDGLADDGISASTPTCALVASTRAAVGAININVLVPAKYLELRHFVATKEKEAKQSRFEALSVFNRVADKRPEQTESGADFGDVNCNSSAFSAKEMELEKRAAELSEEQRDSYDCVVHYLAPGSQVGQLLKFVAGAAGVGKSWLLQAIVLYLRLQYGSDAVEVVAQTNAAAKLVDGHTIDSTFPVAITRSASDEIGLKKQRAAIISFRQKFLFSLACA